MKAMLENLKKVGLSTLMVGSCVAVMGTGVFAAQAEASERALLLQEDSAVYAQEQVDGYGGNAALKEKHQEIDAYVFGEHQGELEDLGFKVTHTGPANGKIEIGITPFEEEYVQHLQEQFGTEDIEVVEGVQAVTLMMVDEEPQPAPAEPGQARTMVVHPDEAVSDAGTAEAVATEVDAVPISAEVSGDEIAVSGASEELALEASAMDQQSVAQSNTTIYAWAIAALAAVLGIGAIIWRKRAQTSK